MVLVINMKRHGKWTAVQVEVNSTFVKDSFKRNLSQGYYSTKDLTSICKSIINELFKRDPINIYSIFLKVTKIWGKYHEENLSSKAIARKYKARNELNIQEIADLLEDNLNSVGED